MARIESVDALRALIGTPSAMVPHTWPDKIVISFGEEIAAGAGMNRDSIREFDRAVASRYQTDL